MTNGMRNAYQQFIFPGDTVIDCGANIGERTRCFAKIAAKVVAVEPIQASRDKIEKAENVIIVPAACGRRPGVGTIRTSHLAPTIGTASMSHWWRVAVQESGRFGSNWDEVIENVPITTLDLLIKQYGRPSFIKIDVEGFEAEVLHGLSTPVNLSFEFTPECRDIAEDCIEHLASLRMLAFAYSPRETFELSEWVTPMGILRKLDKISGNVEYGDVYARC